MSKFKANYALILLIIFALILVACTPQTGVVNTPPASNQEQTQQPAELNKPELEKEAEADTETQVPQVDYKQIGVNENGQIMLLMYHGISDKEDIWVRTPENFKKVID